MENDKKLNSKKLTYVRSDRLKADMTPVEEAKAINEMSEAIVDAIFGKDFGSKAKERLRKRYGG
jgi:hypothetical protein